MVERQRNIGGGLTDPGFAMEPGPAGLVRELQEEIERLWRRIAEVEGREGAVNPEVAWRPLETQQDLDSRILSVLRKNRSLFIEGSTIETGIRWMGTAGTQPGGTPSGPEAFFYTSADGGSGDNRIYFRHTDDTTWRRGQKGTTGTTLPTANVQEGDTFFNTSTSKFYLRLNAAWRDLRLVYESSGILYYDPTSGSDLKVSHLT